MTDSAVRQDARGKLLIDPAILAGSCQDARGKLLVDPALTGGAVYQNPRGNLVAVSPTLAQPLAGAISLAGGVVPLSAVLPASARPGYALGVPSSIPGPVGLRPPSLELSAQFGSARLSRKGESAIWRGDLGKLHVDTAILVGSRQDERGKLLIDPALTGGAVRLNAHGKLVAISDVAGEILRGSIFLTGSAASVQAIMPSPVRPVSATEQPAVVPGPVSLQPPSLELSFAYGAARLAASPTYAVRQDDRGKLLVDPANLAGSRQNSRGKLLVDPALTGGTVRQNSRGSLIVLSPTSSQSFAGALPLSGAATPMRAVLPASARPGYSLGRPAVSPGPVEIRSPSLELSLAYGRPKLELNVFAPSITLTTSLGIPLMVALKSKVQAAADALEMERRALTGRFGNLHYEPRLFLSNIRADELQELPGVLGAAVNVDNERDYTWELKLDVRPTDAFSPLHDWVLVVLDVRADLGWSERYYLGLYRFDFPSGTDDPEGRIWQLAGRSPEWLLMRDEINELVVVPSEAYVLQEFVGLLVRQGWSPSQAVVPWPEDLKTATSNVFGGGSNDEVKTWLDLANALLKMGGFHHMQTDSRGTPVARKIRLPQTSPPLVFYGPHDRQVLVEGSGAFRGNDMLLYEPIGREPDYAAFANEVTVSSRDVNQQGSVPLGAPRGVSTTKGPPVSSTVRNVDPNSPLSVLDPPQGLGYVVSRTEALSSVASREVCDLLANYLLMVSSTFHDKRSFITMLDPRRTYDEVYLVEAENAEGLRVMDGRWQCRSWELPLPVGGVPDVMKHNVSRDSLITGVEQAI